MTNDEINDAMLWGFCWCRRARTHAMWRLADGSILSGFGPCWGGHVHSDIPAGATVITDPSTIEGTWEWVKARCAAVAEEADRWAATPSASNESRATDC